MWRWSKIIFAIYSIQLFPFFLPADEQPKKKSYPLMESMVEFLIFGLISLALIPLSGVSSLSAICVQVFTIAVYALSLYCYPLDSILSFGQYLKLSLAESTVVLALLWSLTATYFFSLYPVLTYPEELLLDVTPCYLHILFTLTTTFLWSCILIYLHHRTQIAVDARKCGVWQPKVKTTTGVNEQQKCPTWRSGVKYSQNAMVTVSSKIYILMSPSSAYPYAPLDALLPYRKVYFPLLAAETGPLHKSRVLSFLMTGVLLNVCAVLVFMLLLSSQYSLQHHIGCLMLAAVNCYLMYSTRKHYSINGPPHRDKYVYDQHGQPPPPQRPSQGLSPYHHNQGEPSGLSTVASQQQGAGPSSGRPGPRVPTRSSSKATN